MADPRPAVARWVLLDGNRLVLAFFIVAGTFLGLLGLGMADVIALDDPDAVRGVATGFIPGLIAFLSIALGINQLVLSQEFGSAGEIRDRIEDLREYRHDVEEVAGAGPSPVVPIGFLTFIVDTINADAKRLEESVQEGVAPDLAPEMREQIEAYAADAIAESDRAGQSLDRLRPGRINALMPVLEYPDSHQLYGARQLQRESDAELPEETRASLGRLVEVLELFSVARTQFRTTYTQRVLAGLSRQLLYVGIPALLVVVVLALTPSDPGPTGGGLAQLFLVSALFAVAISPLALLAAYLVRIATVSERTISAGPFVSRPGVALNGRNGESDREPVEADDLSADGRDGRQNGARGEE